MYLYIYDVFLKRRQFERALSLVETRLTDFGLTGKIARLAALANPRALVADELRFGVKTVVIVGDDATFSRVVSRIADLGVVVGWIPLGTTLHYAEILGVPYGDAAVEVLSRRRIEKIDVANVNGRLFIGALHIPPANFSFALDGQFSVQAERQKMELWVCNLDSAPVAQFFPKARPSPADRHLEVVVRPLIARGFLRTQFAAPTYLPFHELHITAERPISMVVDGLEFKEKRAVVGLAGKTLKCIVGKERGF